MNEGMDEGDILLQKEINIDKDDTSGTLFEKLGDLGADLLLETLIRIKEGSIEAIPQEGEVSYAPMIDKKMAKINWNSKSFDIVNLIRGLNPFLGAYTEINNKRYKIWKAKEIEKDEIENIEKNNEKLEKKYITDRIFILNNRIFVKTLEKFIEILEIQEEGKKRLQSQEFLRGKQF